MRADSMDLNRGKLIYEDEVLAELLEYGYMLHRSLYHRIETFATTVEVLLVRKEIVRLRLRMKEVSHFGEVREILRRGWEQMGLPGLASDIQSSLELRSLETSSSEALRATRLGWTLTLLFGFVAVPALADQVIKPIWKLASGRELNDPLSTIVADAVALLVVFLAVLLMFVVLSPRWSRRPSR